MTRSFSNARFAAILAVLAIVFGAGLVSGAAGQALIIGSANEGGVSNTSLDTTSGGFAWQMHQHGAGVGVYAISDNGVALAGLTRDGNDYGLSATNEGPAGTGAAIVADGRNNPAVELFVNSNAIPPLKVNSSAVVSWLNADLLDGMHASDLLPLSRYVASRVVTIPANSDGTAIERAVCDRGAAGADHVLSGGFDRLDAGSSVTASKPVHRFAFSFDEGWDIKVRTGAAPDEVVVYALCADFAPMHTD